MKKRRRLSYNNSCKYSNSACNKLGAKRLVIRVDKLKAVADYLQVSIEELLEEQEVENERQGSETK